MRVRGGQWPSCERGWLEVDKGLAVIAEVVGRAEDLAVDMHVEGRGRIEAGGLAVDV